jgi:hypothetical protein
VLKKSESNSSEDMFVDKVASSQNIEMCSSQLMSPLSRVIPETGESNQISTDPSSNDQDQEPEEPSPCEKSLLASSVKRRKPKKLGLAEKLNTALKQMTSDRILSHHLPAKMMAGNRSKMVKKAKVTKISSDFGLTIVSCCSENHQTQQSGYLSCASNCCYVRKNI